MNTNFNELHTKIRVFLCSFAANLKKSLLFLSFCAKLFDAANRQGAKS